MGQLLDRKTSVGGTPSDGGDARPRLGSRKKNLSKIFGDFFSSEFTRRAERIFFVPQTFFPLKIVSVADLWKAKSITKKKTKMSLFLRGKNFQIVRAPAVNRRSMYSFVKWRESGHGRTSYKFSCSCCTYKSTIRINYDNISMHGAALLQCPCVKWPIEYKTVVLLFTSLLL